MSSVLAGSAERLFRRSHSSQTRYSSRSRESTSAQVGARAKMTPLSTYMPRVVSGEARRRVRRGEV